MCRLLLIPVLLGMLILNGVAAENARVWIQFTPGQKAAVLGQVQAAGGTVHYEFDHLQAIAVTVPEPALQGLSRNPNVILAEEDPVRVLFSHQTGQTTPYGINLVLQNDLWTGTVPQGTGAKVGVIDSGLYAEHADLKGLLISGSSDPGGAGAWNQDGSGHGTHVVGTILAANNSLGVVGVAPATSVHMVRVFGDSGTWAYSSTLVKAVETARASGAKIISMSLGGSFKSLTEQSAFDKYYSEGTLLIAAAGNDGTSRLSYPASYSSVISVGAVDQNKNWADFSQYNTQVELAAPGVGVLSTVPYVDEATVTTADKTTIHGSQIENAVRGVATGNIVNGGQALASDVNTGWAGKVVLVERGNISFYEKVMNVQHNDGAAVIIYNNAPGAFSGTLGEGNYSTIPAIAISREDGLALREKVGVSATVSSAFTAPASGYAYYDGTSMATPHVSGVAALLWGAFPGKSNVEIRSALQNTAEDLGSPGRDNYYGFGLVRAKAAYDSLAGSSGGGTDTTPPTLSKPVATKLSAKKFKITWITNEPAKSTVTVGVKAYDGTTYTTSHSFSVNGSSGTTYTVRSTDAAGNQGSDGGTLP